MRILFIGDIVGRPGRRMLNAHLERIVTDRQIDLVVANCENAAAGFGITPELADGLLEKGVHVLTSGNHIWDKKAVLPYLDAQEKIVRPANYPDGAPGKGLYLGATAAGVPYAVLNLQGRTYLPPIDCPFRAADAILERIEPGVAVRLVDFHAEVTSEKMAFGWYLDGRATAVLGTHTHVTTADERVLPGGTAYITDVGMTGPRDSVIGMDREASIRRFLVGIPTRFEPASGPAKFSAVIIDADEKTGNARSIERVSVIEDATPSAK